MTRINASKKTATNGIFFSPFAAATAGTVCLGTELPRKRLFPGSWGSRSLPRLAWPWTRLFPGSWGSLVLKAAVAALVPAMLAACGGGAQKAQMPTQQSHAYSGTASVRHSYARHLTHSAKHYVDMEDGYSEVTIGGDVGPRENLRHIDTVGGIRYFLGQTRDGVGVERLMNYEDDLMTSNGTDPFNLSRYGFFPFSAQPRLYYDPAFKLPENTLLFLELVSSVRILNDALPPEFQIRMWPTPHPTGNARRGEILVELETPASVRA